MFGFGAGEILVIIFLALILLGPKKIPQIARMMGRGFREFNKAKDGFLEELHREERKTELSDETEQLKQ